MFLLIILHRAAEQKVQEMAAAGVIEPLDRPWAAPLVIMRKRTNVVTEKDSYLLPHIDDALDYNGSPP